MTAAVIPLPARRVITTPALSREERKAALEQLAWDHVVGVAPSPLVTGLVVSTCACESLTAAMDAWKDYLAECERVRGVEAGDPFWADLEPQLAQADRDEALRYLLDGDRPKPAGGAS